MEKAQSKIKNIFVFIFLSFFCVASVAMAVEPQELKDAINKKAEELKNLNSQIQETQKQYNETQNQARSLKSEVKKIDTNLSQINLGIKASEINIQKLGLEINSLSFNINETESTIAEKKQVIAEYLKEIQQKDNDNILSIFLKHRSLADSISEVQNITSMNEKLNSEVGDLKNLNNDLNNQLNSVSQKKGQVEVENKTLKVKKEITEDQKQEKSTLLKLTQNKESLYQKQLSELEKQQNAIEDSINKLEDELKAKFDTSVVPKKRSGVLAWPIVLTKDGGAGRITQHQGEKSYLYRGKPHNGLDVGAPIGTPIYAAADGVVYAVDNNDRSAYSKYQYGRYVMIKHGNNMSTLYAHLSRQAVSAGQVVKTGDLIGYLGNTGYSTGPHLHFGLYWTPTVTLKSIPPASGLVPIGVVLNPEDYL